MSKNLCNKAYIDFVIACRKSNESVLPWQYTAC